MNNPLCLSLAALGALGAALATAADPPARVEPVPGYCLYECGRLVYAAGMDTGIHVRSPTTLEPLWIAPGAVAAWGDPVPINP